ncbi:ATP-binding cassette domain-containing protein [Photobacterium sp. 1_MG-2023]|uniref:ATP-binding cassette domain-containing protein n=1 Tax=Photobacterium sp. 1_MG-2023 TaxID=3062646 RepID=UPI0026E487C5|nr:ATP-binding cassette domain-containing protein [Photobacterium sp. 1_MG-2023]MDO6705463.1 ATP-binding cassette domain-containing protein [Photobacterium sp. 1_MG-2023]
MCLSVKNLTINNGGKILLKSLSFSVPPGQILTLMGPSGCGKSTLLNVIAGHSAPDTQADGQIRLNDQDIHPLAPEQRRIGLLFQDDLLFPHLNVWQNLAFGLPPQVKKATRQAKAMETLHTLGLLDLALAHPDQISGGQRARISLMRCLLAEPDALLLDEPFSKLDKTLRVQFRDFVFQQIRQQNIPALMVTHDQDDVPPEGQLLHWPEQQSENGDA